MYGYTVIIILRVGFRFFDEIPRRPDAMIHIMPVMCARTDPQLQYYLGVYARRRSDLGGRWTTRRPTTLNRIYVVYRWYAHNYCRNEYWRLYNYACGARCVYAICLYTYMTCSMAEQRLHYDIVIARIIAAVVIIR